ncbi:DNA methyltransferase [Microbacterium sp. KSW2-29]|uniref:site-specific DNA-methyltransferase (cytosine-N(4)-specific) n=1 Tax=Microbacterium phycohabitans TaxID=3075993 RepID=A0ABU3SNU3_9MICO|nr:DNA methyltransferase [Microbacterium sp. KSW2-29]MDU0346469.1 DNA methyltransferase [Microbacterium sp. KSW2-29]
MIPEHALRSDLPTLTEGPAESLEARLDKRAQENPHYWDFRGISGRVGGHGYFQYPAMMVPELQRALLEDLLETDPGVELIYDPFMGSGTVLLESLYLGLSFIGSDINPMAVLLSHVKAHPPQSEFARDGGKRVLNRAIYSTSEWTLNFAHRDKWFDPTVIRDLSRLHEAIRGEEDKRLRRFLWVCLAETVRFVSNSRLSTFKLHKYSDEDMENRSPDALKQFGLILSSNVDGIRDHETALPPNHGTVTLFCEDVMEGLPDGTLVDAIMTSPPYGDNHTTVPYGQYSYLPLQWIAASDLVGEVVIDRISRPGTLDTVSLGGRRLTAAKGVPSQIAEEVPSLTKWINDRSYKNGTTQKVITFVDDYRRALRSADRALRQGGYIFLTLGERRVADADVPLVAFTQEILEALNYRHVRSIDRLLPSRKRMARRNAAGETMARETILIMRKNVA